MARRRRKKRTPKKPRPPVRLTQDVLERFEAALEEVMVYTLASDIVGITRMSGYNWRKRGEAELERVAEEAQAAADAGLDVDVEIAESERLYVDWYLMCRRVRAKKAADLLGRVEEYAADKKASDWKGPAWQLARSFQDEFGDRQTIEHEGVPGPNVSIYLPSNGREVDDE